VAKKKTSSTGRATGGKSVNSRKRTKATASTGNGASGSKKKTSKKSRTTATKGKKGKKATSKKAAQKASSKKATTKKAATSKKTTKKAGGRSTKKSGQSGNQGPLTAKEIEKYRNLLLVKRAEILGDMSSMSEEALGSDSSNLSHMPIHMADVSSDGYERELMLGLVESERQVIQEIDEALQRIEGGTYGICEVTGKPIAKSRLNAKPWAKYCIEAAREMERQQDPSRH